MPNKAIDNQRPIARLEKGEALILIGFFLRQYRHQNYVTDEEIELYKKYEKLLKV